MLVLLALYAIGAIVAPFIMRRGRLGYLILALIPAVSFIAIAAQAGQVRAGTYPESNFAWVPQVNLELTFRLDELSWIMSLIVTGVGTLVLIYCSRYFSAAAQGMGRFAGVFTAFAGAMLGLVTTDNTLALYMFWELTTVFSFLLIGHNYSSSLSRRSAMQAIIVTTTGGLAMLGGIIVLGQIPGGSYRLSELIVAAESGTLGVDSIAVNSIPSWIIAVAIVLVLFGATSKSALIPVHFWLPGAMAAPTPVSAYLHAAAMVKAGVYMVARMAPGFSDYTAWRVVVLSFAIGTLILGGYRATKQNDLKLVLAYGTISQLGLITLMVGYGTADTMLAGLAMLLAHSMFKSTLFLAVGQVDWATGTRDLRKLSGLGKKLPIIATASALACASMMGLPFTAGFVAKEAALHALMGGSALDTISWLAIALGSAFTVAYTIRFWWGAFATKRGVDTVDVKRHSLLMLTPVVLLSLLGIVFGVGPALYEPFFMPWSTTLGVVEGHLHAWGGFNAAFAVTLGVIALGGVTFLLTRHFQEHMHRVEWPLSAEQTYRTGIAKLESLSGHVTGFTQRGSLPAYLSTIFAFTLTVLLLALSFGGVQTVIPPRLWDSWAQFLVVTVTIVAAVLAARARHRVKAVLLMGVSGYGVALVYELYGAPDLALTQVLSETMTLVVFILVLRRLPAYFSNRPLRISRLSRFVLAGATGVAMSLFAWLAAGVRTAEPISTQFHDEAYAFGYGKNIVNVTLVDIRAWDTFGEISVLVACAIGISSLLFIRDRGGRVDRFRNLVMPKTSVSGGVMIRPNQNKDLPNWRRRQSRQMANQVNANARDRTWLVGTDSLRTVRRSVILEVGTRLIFHTILIVSIFFLFSGHNLPGGGFAGGLLAGIALVLRYLAGGRYELGAAIPLNPGHLMGWGLAIAGFCAVVPVFFGGTILQTAAVEFELAGFGHVKLATAIFFDIGVYIAVLGLILDILRSLGAEIDRHGEIEGLDAYDSVVIRPSEDQRREETDAITARAYDESAAETSEATQNDDHEPKRTRTARDIVTAVVGESPTERGRIEPGEDVYDPRTGLTTVAADPDTTSEARQEIEDVTLRKAGE